MAGAGTLSVSSCHSDARRSRTSSRPNILLFLSDQERYPWHLQSSRNGGGLAFRTPHRDGLRSAGAVELRNHFATSPVCSPSRATILTGLYPHQHGIMDNIDIQQDLSPAVRTVGHMLSEAEYCVGYRGKWHLSNMKECSGATALGEYGFDDFECSHLGGDSHVGKQNDASNAKSAADWIRARKGETRPWFLVVSMVNPHDIFWPMLFPRREWDGQYDPAGPDNIESLEHLEAFKPTPQADSLRQMSIFGHFYSDKGFSEYTLEDWRIYNSFYAYLIEKTDEELGKVLAAVREADPELEETVIITTSDHGDSGGAHGLPYKGPWMYKEVLHVPMLIKYPGSEYHVLDTLTSHIDLAPTICDLAHVKPSSNVPLPGESLCRLLKGITEDIHPDGVFAEADFVWLKESDGIRTIIDNIDDETWKYTNYFLEDESGLELYNLTKDIQELDNKAESTPQMVSTLQSRLEQWYASTPADPNA